MSSIRKLIKILTVKDIKDIAILLLVGTLYAAVQALSVAVIFPFINLVVNPQIIYQPGLIYETYKLFMFRHEDGFIVFLGIIVILIILASSVLGTLTLWLKSRFVAYKNHFLSKRLLGLYLHKPYGFFLHRNSSELSKNVLTEINELSNQYILALIDITINSLILLVLIVTLLVVDVTTTLYIFFLLFGTYGLINLYSKRKLKKLGAVRVNSNRLRFKVANEAFSSIKITKVMANEDYFIRKYSESSYKMATTKVYADIIRDLPNHMLDLIAFGGIVGLIVYKVLINDSIQDIIPLISVFALAGYRMKPALNKLYASLANMHYNHAILDKIFEDMVSLNDDYKKTENLHFQDSLSFEHSITLSNVKFCYKDFQEPVLQNINLTIYKNEVIGFIGVTGSGKTTLVDLLMGLHVPSSGEIKIDSITLDQMSIPAWQKRIGYVPQDIILSDDTIAHNIAFGVNEPEIDMEKVEAVAKIAALDEFIESLPHRYNSMVGERGVRISGGQRQRIGIARALYRDCDVLILDEATSSLDTDTEQEVLDAIASAAISRTVIMIAHRLSSLKDAQVIYKVEQGEIIKEGSYEDLYQHE